MPENTVEIIEADISMLNTLIEFRLNYLNSIKSLTDEQKSAVILQLKDYFPRRLGTDCHCFLLYVDGVCVSSVYFIDCEKPAGTKFINGKTAMLMNVVTLPEHRKKGYASKLLEHVIEFAKQRGISCIDLSATEMGQPLYKKHGFYCRGNSEMRLQIKD
ncbi:MAG: GNAT family N-acetyltransferase [Ruminococcus sp.]|jgi:GNAT superfamily N-acetyltransferase|nr:GNAT family N-acetyltransferase [Ruminococcus sp.]